MDFISKDIWVDPNDVPHADVTDRNGTSGMGVIASKQENSLSAPISVAEQVQGVEDLVATSGNEESILDGLGVDSSDPNEGDRSSILGDELEGIFADRSTLSDDDDTLLELNNEAQDFLAQLFTSGIATGGARLDVAEDDADDGNFFILMSEEAAGAITALTALAESHTVEAQDGCGCAMCGGDGHGHGNDGGTNDDDSTDAPTVAGTFQTLADFLTTGFWSSGQRHYNMESTGSSANFGNLYFNVAGFSTAKVIGSNTYLDTDGMTAAR